MSTLTPNFSFYLPAVGDGAANGHPWGPQVNANFTAIDTALQARATYAKLISTAGGDGDELMTVLQPFTGAVSTTQHDVNARIISLADVGAVGDGSTDDTAAIQQALDDLLDGDHLVAQRGKNYLVSSTLNVNTRCTIDWMGSSITYTGTGYAIGFGPSGGPVLTTALTSAVLECAKALPLDSLSGVATGDLVLLYYTADPAYSGAPLTDPHLWPYDKRVGSFYGETNMVKAVGASSIDIEIPTATAYDVTSIKPVVKIYRPWKSCGMRNLHLKRAVTSNSITGLAVSWCLGATFENILVEGFGGAGISDGESWGNSYKNCNVLDAWFATVELGYGIQTNGSTFTMISDCKFWNCRRGVDYSGAYPSRYCTAVDCIAQGDYTSAAGSEAVNAYGTHGTAQYCTFENCSGTGFYNFALVRGTNIRFINCTGYKITSVFITISTGYGLVVEGCKTTSPAVASGTNPYPTNIIIDCTSPNLGVGILGVFVRNCQFEGYGTLVSCSALVPACDFHLDNVKVIARDSSMKLITGSTGAVAINVYTNNVQMWTKAGNIFSYAITAGSATFTVMEHRFFQGHRRRELSAATAPATGSWQLGDIVWNTAPATGGASYIGWVCTVAGTPGTWKGFGLVA